MRERISLRKRLSIVAVRLRASLATDDIVIRLRWFFLFTGLLLVYIGFQAGDDWYVKEFATYDWARGLGY